MALLASRAVAQFSDTVDATPCAPSSLNSHVTAFTTDAGGTGSGSAKTYYVNASSVSLDYCANGPGLAAVQLYEKTAAAGSATLAATDVAPTPSETSSGTFSDRALSQDGTYEYYTRAANSLMTLEDAPSSPDLTVIRDTQAPAPTFTAPSSPTRDTTPNFQGTAGNATADSATVAVKVYEGSNTSGTLIRTLTLSRSGTAWSAQDADWSAALGDGTYTAQATQTDAAGNSGTSPARTFTVDTASPVVGFDNVPAYTNDTTPGFQGTAGNAAGDSNTVTVKIYSGTAATGTAVETINVTRSGASWTVSDVSWLGKTPLGAGTYTAQAEQTDSAGNPAGLSPARTFTVDTAAPGPTVAAVASPTNDRTPAISGTAGTAAGDSNTVTVEVYSGGAIAGEPHATVTTTRSAGAWQLSDSDWGQTALADGTYTVQAKQADDAGNTGTSSTPRTFAVDGTPPAVSMNAPAASTSDNTPAFAGAAGNASGDSNDVIVRIYSGTAATGTPVQTLTVQRSGALSNEWTVDNATWATALLADGTYTAQAKQDDNAGNTGASLARTFSVDTANPAAPSIDSTPSDPTNQTNASFAFTPAESGGTMKCQLDAGPVANCTSRTGQSYSSLSQGSHTFTVHQVDAAGNAGTPATYTWTVDTTAPAVSLNALPAETADATPAASGNAGNASGDSQTVTLSIYSGGAATGTPVRSFALTRSAGSWQLVDGDWGTSLPDGTYTARASQADNAGNTGNSSASTFRVLTGVRTAASSPATRTNGSQFQVTYTITDGTGNALTPAQAHVTKVELWAAEPGSSQFALVDTDNNPSVGQALGFSYTPAAGDGSYRFYTVGYDGATALETKIAADSTTLVDSQPPAPTMTQPASPTSDTKPNLTGSAGDASGDSPTVSVKVYSGPAVAGQPVHTLTATRSATTWTLTDSDWPAALSNGTYTAQATQSDSAGNSGNSAARTFTVDGTAPAVTMAQPTARTKDTTPAFSGTAANGSGDSTTVTVEIYEGGAASGTPVRSIAVTRGGALSDTWSVADGNWGSPLADGTYTARAVQTDNAGNSGESAHRTFAVDTTAPAVTLSAPSTPTNDASPTLTGDAGSAAGDEANVAVKVYSGSSATGQPVRTISVTRFGGSWSTQNSDWSPALADGTYTVQASQADDLGNTAASAARTFSVDTVAPAAPALDGKPAARTNSRSANFTIARAESGGAMRCKLDGGEASPCESATGQSYTGLADGDHSFSVIQRDDAGNESPAATHTWTVDGSSPSVGLTQPADGTDTTPALGGRAGNAAGDATTILVRIFSGAAASGTPVQSLSLTRSGASWSTTDASYSAPLAPGTYTARAFQADDAGNVGASDARTFTVAAVPIARVTGFALTFTSGQSLASVIRRGLGVRFTTAEPVTGSLRLLIDSVTARRVGLARAVVVGKRAVNISRAGKSTLRVILTRKAKSRLKTLQSVRLTLKGTLTGASGKKTAIRRVIRLKR